MPEGNFSRGERLSEERHGRNGRGRHIRRPLPILLTAGLSPGRSPSEDAARTRACPPRATPRGTPGSPRAGRSMPGPPARPVSSHSAVSSRASRTGHLGLERLLRRDLVGLERLGLEGRRRLLMLGGLAVRPRLGGLQLVRAGRSSGASGSSSASGSSGASSAEAGSGAGLRPRPKASSSWRLTSSSEAPCWRFSSRCSRMASSRLPMDGYH